MEPETRPPMGMQSPSVPRYGPDRDPVWDEAQLACVMGLDKGGALLRDGVTLPDPPAPPEPEPEPEPDAQEASS